LEYEHHRISPIADDTPMSSLKRLRSTFLISVRIDPVDEWSFHLNEIPFMKEINISSYFHPRFLEPPSLSAAQSLHLSRSGFLRKGI
jgi:hypothetical protein